MYMYVHVHVCTYNTSVHLEFPFSSRAPSAYAHVSKERQSNRLTWNKQTKHTLIYTQTMLDQGMSKLESKHRAEGKPQFPYFKINERRCVSSTSRKIQIESKTTIQAKRRHTTNPGKINRYKKKKKNNTRQLYLSSNSIISLFRTQRQRETRIYHPEDWWP